MPNSDYTRRSRLLIVGAEAPAPQKLSIMRMLRQSFQYGSSIVVTAAVVLLLLGGFSLLHTFSPLSKLSSLDTAALQAEAQAVDMQIQLTNLNYSEPAQVTTTVVSSVPPPATIKKISQAKELMEPTSSPATTITLSPASDTPDIGIDEALQKLSQ